MKQVMIFALSMLLLVFFSTAICFADEIKGEVVKMDSSRLVVKVNGEGNRSFDMTRTTKIFNGGMPSPVKHILPHTIVRVESNYGKAEWIFFVEAPK